MIELRVLGPFEVLRDTELVTLLGPKERSLLALLTIHVGEVVSADRLIEDLWRGDPPANPSNSLQAVVSRVRRALGIDGVLVTRKPGYVLVVDPGQIDVRRFEGLLGRARRVTSDDPSRASTLLAEALGLWRGDPFADLAYDDVVGAERTRLEELRVAATEEKIAADLAVGRHSEVLPQLEQLVNAYPFRERLRAQHMVALYGCGRQAEAIAVYDDARRVLRDELGLDPGPELERVFQQVLGQDPALERLSQHVPDVTDTNLPARVSSFVGREAELREVRSLVQAHRLVTVAGPGGAGKTSLAIEVGRALMDSWARGVWLVELAPLSEASQVVPAICTTFGLPEETAATGSSSAPIARLTSYLRTKAVLLILDNCEHVVQRVAEVCDALLAGCPELKILVSSREVLGSTGEFVWSIPPLALPADDDSPQAALACDSMRLLADRAASAGARLKFDSRTTAAAAEICRRLDGMPLGIELAAARARSLSLSEIATRLDRRFTLLTTRGRTVVPRHRTLGAVIDWSHELLTVQEQMLFRRVAVFSSGWTLEAAERVCSGPELADVLDVLGRLVDRSLIVARGGRFGMFETILAYAQERVIASGEEDDLRARHAAFFKELMERSEPGLRGPDQASVLRQLRDDASNLRQALQWGREHAVGQPDLGLGLAASLGWYWYVGRQVEGRFELRSMLDTAQNASDETRARALQALSLALRPAGCIVHASPEAADAARDSAALFERLGMADRASLSQLLVAVEGVAGGDVRGYLAAIEDARKTLESHGEAWGVALADFIEMEIRLYHDSPDAALTLGERAADTFDSLRDAWGRSAVRLHLGIGLRLAGRSAEARQVLDDAVTISRDTDLPSNLARSLIELGEVALFIGDLDDATRRFDECEELVRNLADGTLQALLWSGRGDAGRYRDDLVAARHDYGLALTLFRESGVPRGEARALLGLAAADLDARDVASARRLLERALELGRELEDPALSASALEQLARLYLAEGVSVEGIRLLDEADGVRALSRRPRGALADRDTRRPDERSEPASADH